MNVLPLDDTLTRLIALRGDLPTQRHSLLTLTDAALLGERFKRGFTETVTHGG